MKIVENVHFDSASPSTDSSFTKIMANQIPTSEEPDFSNIPSLISVKANDELTNLIWRNFIQLC